MGIPEGFRGIPYGFAGIPWDSAWVATMSFQTSGASGISPIIILEARILEIPGCESPYLALSSSVHKALYLPLVSTVLEFFYRILESAPVLLGSRSFPALQPLPHPAPGWQALHTLKDSLKGREAVRSCLQPLGACDLPAILICMQHLGMRDAWIASGLPATLI